MLRRASSSLRPTRVSTPDSTLSTKRPIMQVSRGLRVISSQVACRAKSTRAAAKPAMAPRRAFSVLSKATVSSSKASLMSKVSVQRRSYAKTVQEQIADQIKASKVVVYMKGSPNAPQCGFSRQVVDVLKRSGAEFTAYNVLESEAVRNGIKEFTSWPTIPQVFIKGEFVGGCDIVTEMYRDGSLETALQEAGAIKKKAEPTA